MHDPDDAARAADLIRIYRVALKSPVLSLPFSGPDRSAFYFTDREPGAVRQDVETAKQAFAEGLGATFGDPHDEQAPNGINRLHEAELPSGLKVVLIARAEHMQDQDGAVRELAGIGAAGRRIRPGRELSEITGKAVA